MCHKVLCKFDKAFDRYKVLNEVRYKNVCKSLKNISTSLILLPLMKPREGIEDILTDFIELQQLYNPDHLFDIRVHLNL